ncbi:MULTISPECIES: GmrSD restriction endonuclease domain-containing protein [Bacteria]
MGSATNVDAVAVNTVAWLSAPETAIVVPVYQRQYRWDIGGCEQLLGDIRAVADLDDRNMHFIGSILSTVSADTDASTAPGELVLIDGQQRITTLMLLVAALHHTVQDDDPELAAELERVLVRADDPDHTKLRPHRAWARVFESVVLDRRGEQREPEDAYRESRFDDNYAFFRSQVRLDEVPRIWRGLQKLEHVAITLGSGANAQQIFESLNSTGEPLRDHELIHNYVLMGLSHAEQSEIEDAYWVPIERNTGEAIASFWRHFLVMTTGREVAVAGERSVYDAFRQRFPRLDLDTLRANAAEWRDYSDIYRILLDPSQEPDAEISRQLGYVNTFGRAIYPLVMRAYRDYALGVIERAELIATLENIQSLLLRRTVSGLSNDRLVARLCRAREDGPDALVRAIARIMPSNERVRVELKYGALPHAAYVLGRLAGVESHDGLELEHVFPLAPADTWTGDGERTWADYSEDEQNSHRALAPTLGNLTLVETPLAERGFDASFPEKRDALYPQSRVTLTTAIMGTDAWGTAAITARTAALTEAFVEIWARPQVIAIDDDGLTPILDAVRRRGWPRGWEREFEYVEYRGEHWEVYDIKYLFNRIFKRLWADGREHVVAFSARRGGPLYPEQAWNGQWDALDESTFLYMGWDSRYMLTAVQGVLDEAGIASEVFVKYSYTGAAM